MVIVVKYSMLIGKYDLHFHWPVWNLMKKKTHVKWDENNVLL
jgi:hypothetical protein